MDRKVSDAISGKRTTCRNHRTRPACWHWTTRCPTTRQPPQAQRAPSWPPTGCRSRSRCAARAATEVRHVPARTLELEAGSGELLLERRRAACGAIRQRRVAHLLQHIFGVAAGVASISIDRHGVLTLEQTNDKKAMDCPRGPRTRCEKRARRAHGRLGQLRAVQVLARKALNYKPFRGNSRPQIRSGRWRCATKWHTAHARNETLRLA